MSTRSPIDSKVEFHLRRRTRCDIRAAEVGKELLHFLAERFDYHSIEEWEKLISRNRLLINDRPGQTDSLLAVGDTVEFIPSEKPEPPVVSRYIPIFEDESVLAVAKPGNLPTHPAGRFFNHTLWALLKRDRPNMPIHFVNRLDRETSGIVLIAKTPEVCARCAACLDSDKTEKLYLAIVESVFPSSVTAEGFLIPDNKSKIRKKIEFIPENKTACSSGKYDVEADRRKARRATTSFRKVRDNGALSLIEASLRSGRTHQIRATLVALGFPLVGDKLYGVDETIFLRFIAGRETREDRRRLRIRRQALHAAKLILPHPSKQKMLELTAPVPEEMRKLI